MLVNTAFENPPSFLPQEHERRYRLRTVNQARTQIERGGNWSPKWDTLARQYVDGEISLPELVERHRIV